MLATSSRKNASRLALAVGAFALVGMASTGCKISFSEDKPAANQGGTSPTGGNWGSQGGGAANTNSNHSPIPSNGAPKGSYGITVGAGVSPSSIYVPTCGTPRTVTLVGTIRVTHAPVTVRYQWYDSVTGAYSPPQSVSFQSPGARTISEQWKVSHPGTYGAALRVLSPYAVQSGRYTVTYKCAGGNNHTDKVTVPTLANLPKHVAIARLSTLGLKYTTTYVVGHGYPETVSKTYPAAYSVVPKGSVVTLYIYKEDDGNGNGSGGGVQYPTEPNNGTTNGGGDDSAPQPNGDGQAPTT